MRLAPPVSITQPELARLLGLTARQVRNLTNAGVLRVVIKEGNIVFYPLRESVLAFISYREGLARRRHKQNSRGSDARREPRPP